MKKRLKQHGAFARGIPSAVVLSLLIHAALFLLAGMLVVFTVVKKEEKKFVPPKAVERPKMNLRKPKVNFKKTSNPKPTTRIVAKVTRASMPDIQLPEMSGISAGLGGGIGGFELMPDLDEVSVFGSGQSIGNDFVGMFYDFKRDRRGRTIIMDLDKFMHEVKEFVRSGWNPSKLARYYRSPKKLYTTTFMIPPVLSSVAPSAFSESDTLGYSWLAHYKGQLVHQDGITFRFWGMGDDLLLVRVDGRLVLNACWWRFSNSIEYRWQSSSADSRKYHMGNGFSVVGDWITLAPGVPFNMEVVIGEIPGGTFAAMLVVEVQGEEYARNFEGGPILPIFKTTEPSLDLIEAIHSDLVEGEACVTNGPVFRDYGLRKKAAANGSEKATPVESVVADRNPEDIAMRSWTGLNGESFFARFVTMVGTDVVLKDSRNRQVKIPLFRFSEEDRMFIELALPPTFNISFSKQSAQRIIKQSPFNGSLPPKLLDYVFSAKLKQTSAGAYNHELQIEFFAIGEEIDGDNYILFDRQKSSFTPDKENMRSHRFCGEKVTLMDVDFMGTRRGEKYGGYLVVITDVRGRIIDYSTSHKWLFENIRNLEQIPVGKHFNKKGCRVGPPRPIRNY